MKKGIHPEYRPSTIVCSCGNRIETRSTQEEIHVEICAVCHPFYTGRQKLVDTAGRVERFKKKYGDTSLDAAGEEGAGAGQEEGAGGEPEGADDETDADEVAAAGEETGPAPDAEAAADEEAGDEATRPVAAGAPTEGSGEEADEET